MGLLAALAVLSIPSAAVAEPQERFPKPKFPDPVRPPERSPVLTVHQLGAVNYRKLSRRQKKKARMASLKEKP